MRERVLRTILAGILLVMLFLPADRYAGSNWEAAFLYSVEAPVCLPFYLTLPTLLLLNVCLAIWPSKKLRSFYRIAVLLSLPLVLYVTLLMAQGQDPAFPSIGCWARPVAVLGAVLAEAILLAYERLKKSGNE